MSHNKRISAISTYSFASVFSVFWLERRVVCTLASPYLGTTSHQNKGYPLLRKHDSELLSIRRYEPFVDNSVLQQAGSIFTLLLLKRMRRGL